MPTSEPRHRARQWIKSDRGTLNRPFACSSGWRAAETARQGEQEKGDMKVQHEAVVNQDESRQTGVGARWRGVQGRNREIQPAKDGITRRDIILKRCGTEVWTVLQRLSKRILKRKSTTDRYEPTRTRCMEQIGKPEKSGSNDGWPTHKDQNVKHKHTCLTCHRYQSYYKVNLTGR